MKRTEGMHIPIHKSLIAPKFWLGIPRMCLLGIIFLGILGTVIIKSWIIPIIALSLFFALKYAYSYDRDFFTVMYRYMQQDTYYF